MVTGVSACLVYLACAGFYQAGPRRAQLPTLKRNVNARRMVYAFAWGLMLIAFLLVALPQGLERGIPIWLGLLTTAGIGSLLLVALRPDWHLPSIVVAVVLATMFGAGAVIA